MSSFHQDELYEICLSTCDDGQDGHDLFPNEPNMAGDRYESDKDSQGMIQLYS